MNCVPQKWVPQMLWEIWQFWGKWDTNIYMFWTSIAWLVAFSGTWAVDDQICWLIMGYGLVPAVSQTWSVSLPKLLSGSFSTFGISWGTPPFPHSYSSASEDYHNPWIGHSIHDFLQADYAIIFTFAEWMSFSPLKHRSASQVWGSLTILNLKVTYPGLIILDIKVGIP